MKRANLIPKKNINVAKKEVNNDSRDQTGKGIDGVVGLDVDGGEAHEEEEGEHAEEEAARAAVPRQEHEDGGDTDMAAGEGGGGALAGIVGNDDEVVEETVAPAGDGQALLVGGEIVAEVGEDAARYVVETHGLVVELGTGDGEEHKDDVVGKERGGLTSPA